MFNVLNLFRGNPRADNDDSVAVPVLDGALKPNNLLESAEVLAEAPGLEDIAVGDDGELYAACSDSLVRIDGVNGPHVVAGFDAPVQALAPLLGGMAVATAGVVCIKGGKHNGKRLDAADGRPLACVTALHATPAGKLMISDGSADTPCDQWSRDLLNHGHSGRVIEYDPATGATAVLASGLAYCHAAYADGKRVLVSESWAHRIVALEDGRYITALGQLPGYPARISPAKAGGYWLSIFAARTQLVEFILREDEFRREMMRTVEPCYWIAPALQSGADFREPLQLGSVRQMGILKPWAPPRSYGLVIRLDADLKPCYSLHSRVGGKHHGIVSAVEHGEYLVVASKGAGRILRLPLANLNAQV